jgi:hypothetical protein
VSNRQRIRTGAFALILLLAALAPATTAPAASGPAGTAIDDAPGIWSRIQVLWTSITQWLSPQEFLTAASGEEPPPEEEEEEEDPFGGGGAGGGPGGGTGLADPNGGSGT